MTLELTMVCSEELDSSYDKFYIWFLGGLSLHLNHLIA